MKNARPQTSETSALDKSDSNTNREIFPELSLEKHSPKDIAKAAAKFVGTSNPRELRAIYALMHSPRFRCDLQRITGAANTPDLVSRMRALGLETPCRRVPVPDRDGAIAHPGIYSFNETDRRKINAWLSKRGAA